MNTKLHRLLSAAPVAAAVGVGVALLAGSGTALAAPTADSTIQYNDLNTTTPAGVQQLSDRVRDAAWSYCLKVAPPANGPDGIDNLHCQQAVIVEALGKINNPLLTQKFPRANDADTFPSG